jgi:hypothetical protein
MAFWGNNVILVEVALARDENQSMKRNRLSEEQIIGILKDRRLGCRSASQIRH